MSVAPLISIKAGRLSRDGNNITPQAELGLLYLYISPDDDLLHFCWKPRGDVDPTDDLLIFPGEARFIRYTASTTGRICVLKFSSSSQRHFFWLQSKSESPEGDAGHWSERDIGWVNRIDNILTGGDVADGDEEMADAPSTQGLREAEGEGEDARRGGEDGGRASGDVPNFESLARQLAQSTSGGQQGAGQQPDLQSLIRSIQVPGGATMQQTPTISLHDLLAPTHVLPLLPAASAETIDNLISNLPPGLIPATASLDEKKTILEKVIRSPQLNQALVSLSAALREGGLRSIAEAVRVPLEAGAEASGKDQVELFVGAVKKQVEKEKEGKGGEGA